MLISVHLMKIQQNQNPIKERKLKTKLQVANQVQIVLLRQILIHTPYLKGYQRNLGMLPSLFGWCWSTL